MALVTKEAVFAAADALTAEGKNPTQTTVRDKIGGGSYSSIGGLLNDWRASAIPKTMPAKLSPPPTSLQTMLDGMWTKAQELAHAGLENDRSAWEASRVELQDEKASAIAFADTVAGKLDVAMVEIERLGKVADDLSMAHAQEMTKTRDQLEAVNVEAASAKAVADALTHELEAMRAGLAASQADVAKLTGELQAALARESKPAA